MQLNLAIDRNKTPEENILILLQSATKPGVALTDQDFSYKTSVLSINDQAGRNTGLLITALPTSQFDEGEKLSFTYRRPPPYNRTVEVLWGSATTPSDLTQEISDKAYVMPDEFDGWDAIESPVTGIDEKTYTLTAKADSLMYTESFTVRVIYREQDLMDNFTGNLLEAFMPAGD